MFYKVRAAFVLTSPPGSTLEERLLCLWVNVVFGLFVFLFWCLHRQDPYTILSLILDSFLLCFYIPPFLLPLPFCNYGYLLFSAPIFHWTPSSTMLRAISERLKAWRNNIIFQLIIITKLLFFTQYQVINAINQSPFQVISPTCQVHFFARECSFPVRHDPRSDGHLFSFPPFSSLKPFSLSRGAPRARGGRGSGGERSETHSGLGILRPLLPLLWCSCRGNGTQAYVCVVQGSCTWAVLGSSGEPITGAVTVGHWCWWEWKS